MTFFLSHYTIKLQGWNSQAVGDANATETEPEMCTTRACVRAAARILARLDPTVDPCDDFYTFSCGSFLETSTVPDDANALSTLQEMQDEMLHTTRSGS